MKSHTNLSEIMEINGNHEKSSKSHRKSTAEIEIPYDETVLKVLVGVPIYVRTLHERFPSLRPTLGRSDLLQAPDSYSNLGN